MFTGPVFNNEVVQANSRAIIAGGISESLDKANYLYSRLTGASFALAPSSYKEDVVYAGLPNNGNGDLSFTRASDAWRTNASGLVQRTPWNLFQQSETFSNVYWYKNGTSITANSITAPNGTLTADTLVENNANTFHVFGKSLLSLGINTYTISFYAKAKERSKIMVLYTSTVNKGYGFDLANGTTSSVSGIAAADSYSITSVGDGWYRCEIGISSSTIGTIEWTMLTSFTTLSYQGDGTSGLYIWGAQLVQGSSAQTYFPTTDRLNVPRLDYSQGSCPALLLEPQRTNLGLQSEDFDNTAWTKTRCSITANSVVSPDGNTTADTLVEDTTATSSHPVSQAVTLTAAAQTFSIYAKAANRNWIFISFLSTANASAFFNLSNGTIGTVGSATTASIQSVGNGWYRCIITATTASGVNTLGIYPATADAANVYTGNGTASIYIWGAQCEVGAYATTYIKTTTASATRVADACYKTGISSLIGQTEGTLFLDFVFKTSDSSVGGQIGISDSAKFNRVILWNNSTFNTLALQLKANNSNAINNLSLGTFVDGTRYKIAIAYKSGDTAVYVDGVQKITNLSTFTFSNSLTDFILGSYETTLTVGHQFCFKSASFTTRLSNSQLIELTTT